MRITALLMGLSLLAAPIYSKKKSTGQEFLRDVHAIEVSQTIVALKDHSSTIEETAPNLIQDNLRAAVRDAGFDVSESPISIHFTVEEFSSGSTAARLVIGLGAGRSSITGRLILQTMDGKELANVRLHVNGSMDAYQKGSTQRQEALRRLQQAVLEQLEVWK